MGCALLSERFSNLDPSDSTIRLAFETLALCGCGLFTSELLRNRRLSLSTQERLRVLVETSPAAIVTIDEHGFIELANRAATELMVPRDGQLIGNVSLHSCLNCTTLCSGKIGHSSGPRCNAAATEATAKRFWQM
jgi:PAS domain-containing protein